MFKQISLRPAKPTWLLAIGPTGYIYTGRLPQVYTGRIQTQISNRDKALAEFNSTGKKIDPQSWSFKSDVNSEFGIHELEFLDHQPVYEMRVKFKYIANDKLYVTTEAGHPMMFNSASTDKFFLLVGEGRIKIDSDGFYTANIGFGKNGDSVSAQLEGY